MEGKVEKRALHTPSLEELVTVLGAALRKNFADVVVEAEQCPDLQQRPWSLAARGLCGHASIVDVGGPKYLTPLPQLDKLYTFGQIAAAIGQPGCLMIGAGAGSPQVMGVNSELMPNLRTDHTSNNTHVCKVDEADPSKYILSRYSSDEFALLCNLLASDGLPGPVLHVRCKDRTEPQNFVTCMRLALAEVYGNERPVGLGGVFVIKAGTVNAHVMPDFSKTPLDTDQQVNEWLNFYEMPAPLTCLSVFVSGDMGLDLRVEHTHFFSEHGCGGHYHNDMDTHQHDVVYEGYFVPAGQLFRVDRP